MEAILVSPYKDILIIFNIPILFDGIIVISDKGTLLDDEAFFEIIKKWRNLAFCEEAK
jgi:hypothetical protein